MKLISISREFRCCYLIKLIKMFFNKIPLLRVYRLCTLFVKKCHLKLCIVIENHEGKKFVNILSTLSAAYNYSELRKLWEQSRNFYQIEMPAPSIDTWKHKTLEFSEDFFCTVLRDMLCNERPLSTWFKLVFVVSNDLRSQKHFWCRKFSRFCRDK